MARHGRQEQRAAISLRLPPFLLRGAGELEADMLAAVEQMPEDWDKTELGW
jgi:hypothetical protein